MTLKENIYNAIPPYYQNFLISFYGYSLFRKRYSKPFDELLEEIKSIDKLSSEEIYSTQLKKLSDILCHADKYVPYYHSLFRKINFKPQKFQEIKDLEKIPPLEKDVFRNNFESFRSTRKTDKSFIVQKTSGSTGKPLEIAVDELTYKRAMALLVHHEEEHGVRFGAPRATFAGRMIQPVEKNSPPFSRFNKAENQMIFSSYHISEKNLTSYIRELEVFKPSELIGYPSAIYGLAFFIDQYKIKIKFKPRLIVTNSETLLDWQKALIEKVFEAPVKDYYGTAEYIIFASQCLNDKYHINPALGHIEVVDENNIPIYDAEGDILCTTTSNFVMPLIRFRVGDRAIMSSQKCDCGKHTPVLKKVIGRIDDYILTKDNRKIGRLDHIYKGLTGIQEGQLIQCDRDLCRVKIVKSNIVEKIDEDALINNFHERVGHDMKLLVEYVDEIPKGKNGKFKAVINKLGDCA